MADEARCYWTKQFILSTTECTAINDMLWLPLDRALGFTASCGAVFYLHHQSAASKCTDRGSTARPTARSLRPPTCQPYEDEDAPSRPAN